MKIAKIRISKDALVVIALIALTLILFGKVLFSDKTLFGGDILGGYPARYDAVRMIKSGIIPHWNPYIRSGSPLIADLVPQVFYPLTMILNLSLPLDQVPKYGAFLHIVLGGVFTFLFAKAIGLGRVSSFVSGLCFMFSGCVISLCYAGQMGKMDTLVWLPVIFFLLEKTLTKKSLFYCLLTGGALGMQILATHVQIVFYTWIGIFLYFIYKSLFVLRENRRPKRLLVLFGLFVLSFVIGISLSAVQFLPSYQLAFLSERAGGGDSSFGMSWSLPPEELLSLIVPEFFGLKEGYWGRMRFHQTTIYAGILPLLLIAVALVFKRNKTTLFFSFLTLLSIFLALGKYNPVYRFIFQHFPGFDMFRVPLMILRPLFSFSVAVLAGIGCSHLIEVRREDSRRVVWFNRGLLLFSLLFIVAAALSFLFRQRLFLLMKSGSLGGNPFFRSAEIVDSFPFFLSGLFIATLLLIAGTFLIFLRIRNQIKPRTWAVFFLPILLFDLWRIDLRFIEARDIKGYFAKNKVVEYLQNDPEIFRVFFTTYERSLTAFPIPRAVQLFKIQSTTGLVNLPIKWYHQVLRNRYVQYYNFLDMLNVKYILSSQVIDTPRLELVLDGETKVYRNKGALPRAWVVYKTKNVMGNKKILEEIIKPSFKPWECAIFGEEPEVKLPDEPLHPPNSQLKIAHSPNEILLEAKVDNDCFLVLSEIYYPAWKAYVDGKRTKIYKTDYMLRSIYLPRGEHTVRFVYDSLAFKIGAGASIFTLAFLTAALIYGLRHRSTHFELEKSKTEKFLL